MEHLPDDGILLVGLAFGFVEISDDDSPPLQLKAAGFHDREVAFIGCQASEDLGLIGIVRDPARLTVSPLSLQRTSAAALRLSNILGQYQGRSLGFSNGCRGFAGEAGRNCGGALVWIVACPSRLRLSGMSSFGGGSLLHGQVERITNAAAEGPNSKIQSIKPAARGFRKFGNRHRVRSRLEPSKSREENSRAGRSAGQPEASNPGPAARSRIRT